MFGIAKAWGWWNQNKPSNGYIEEKKEKKEEKPPEIRRITITQEMITNFINLIKRKR